MFNFNIKDSYCPRAISAKVIGYNPVFPSITRINLDKHIEDCEKIAINHVNNHGVYNIDSTVFMLQNLLFHLCGKYNVLLLPQYNNKRSIPIKIATFDNDEFAMFQMFGFEKFINYDFEVCCYIKATDKPLLFWTMNRETGEDIPYIVNDSDYVSELNYERIDTFSSYPEYERKITDAVISGSCNILSDEKIDDDRCMSCGYRWLCGVLDTPEFKIDDTELINIAKMYKNACDLESLVKNEQRIFVKCFIDYAKQNSKPVFRVGDILTFSYNGLKTKIINGKTSKPFPDFRIRMLG